MTECTASDVIEALPVIAAATNLEIAIRISAANEM
jgi:hypothetical protein